MNSSTKEIEKSLTYAQDIGSDLLCVVLTNHNAFSEQFQDLILDFAEGIKETQTSRQFDQCMSNLVYVKEQMEDVFKLLHDKVIYLKTHLQDLKPPLTSKPPFPCDQL